MLIQTCTGVFNFLPAVQHQSSIAHPNRVAATKIRKHMFLCSVYFYLQLLHDMPFKMRSFDLLLHGKEQS